MSRFSIENCFFALVRWILFCCISTLGGCQKAQHVHHHPGAQNINQKIHLPFYVEQHYSHEETVKQDFKVDVPVDKIDKITTPPSVNKLKSSKPTIKK